jgi:hypothetical protein
MTLIIAKLLSENLATEAPGFVCFPKERGLTDEFKWVTLNTLMPDAQSCDQIQ